MRHRTVSGWMGGGQVTAGGEAAGSGRASITCLLLRSCTDDARRQVTDARGHMVKGKDLAVEIACCYTEGARKSRGLRRAEIYWQRERMKGARATVSAFDPDET